MATVSIYILGNKHWWAACIMRVSKLHLGEEGGDLGAAHLVYRASEKLLRTHPMESRLSYRLREGMKSAFITVKMLRSVLM
jgi:hypothetical protein